MTPKSLIIFDLDGTLFETELTVSRAVNRACADLGLAPPDPSRTLAGIGLTGSDFVLSIASNLDSEATRQLDDLIGRYEREAIRDIGRLFPRVTEMLHDLKTSGHKLAVCSNGSRGYIDLVLSTTGVARFFDHIRGADSGRGKAAEIADLVRQTGSRNAVFVGDRLSDFEAARANRIPSIGVSYGYGGDEIAEADFVADSAEDVLFHVARCEIFGLFINHLSRPQARRPVIGVNGIDTSGKTIFADALARYLTARGRPTQVVHLDDFHNPRDIRSKGPNEVRAYIENAFDLERLRTELLDPIRRGDSTNKTLRLLDLDTDEFSRSVTFEIGRDTAVILEGVLLYRPPLDEYFDCRIFLDVGFDEMLRRAEARDVPRFGPQFLERYRRKYVPIQQWYLDEYDPASRSDFMVDNNKWRRPILTKAPASTTE